LWDAPVPTCATCAVGYFMEGSTCMACTTTECDVGFYRGTCSDTSDAPCEECSMKPINSNWTSGCTFACHAGFASANCDRCSSDYFCSEAGTCSVRNGSAWCTCDPGFTGESCQHCNVDFHCTSSQQSVACLAKNRYVFCECSRNFSSGFWGGEKCSRCDEIHSCGKGITDRTTCGYEGEGLVCTNCAARFTGDRCSECKAGFTGEDCDVCAPGYYPTSGAAMCQTFCDPDTTCNGRGECGSDGECLCQVGWKGTDCGNPCAETFDGLDTCPSHLPYIIAYKYASRHCAGDCESCTTPEMWVQFGYLYITTSGTWLRYGGAPPTCQFADNKTYRLFQGEKCWAAPHTCTARSSDIVGVACIPIRADRSLYSGFC